MGRVQKRATIEGLKDLYQWHEFTHYARTNYISQKALFLQMWKLWKKKGPAKPDKPPKIRAG